MQLWDNLSRSFLNAWNRSSNPFSLSTDFLTKYSSNNFAIKGPKLFFILSVKISTKIHINFRTRFSKKSLKSKPFVTNFSAFKMASRLTHIEASHLKSTATEDFIAKKSRNALDYWADWWVFDRFLIHTMPWPEMTRNNAEIKVQFSFGFDGESSVSCIKYFESSKSNWSSDWCRNGMLPSRKLEFSNGNCTWPQFDPSCPFDQNLGEGQIKQVDLTQGKCWNRSFHRAHEVKLLLEFS